MELEAVFPTIYEGMGPNSSLSKEHRLDIVRAYRTLERLNEPHHTYDQRVKLDLANEIQLKIPEWLPEAGL